MKNEQHEFAMQYWLGELTFQMQALLMTAIRGADGTMKHNNSKCLSRYLRGTVLKPAGDWNGKNNNNFMWGQYELFEGYAMAFIEDHDEYPHHFIMHLVHSAEVIGYCHPNKEVKSHWRWFYFMMCESFHMTPETKEQMFERLNDFDNCNIQKQST